MTKALLALEDGTIFWGRSIGAKGEATGEVVFQHVYDWLSGNCGSFLF